jgi:hypothetical protein
MPEFTTVSVQEAKLRTASGRQERYLHEYSDYIIKLPKGQAGRLKISEQENPLTIRRRLGVAAQTLGISLIIKRSGGNVYFWREDGEEEQPKSKRRYTRRARSEAETTLRPADLPLDARHAMESEIFQERQGIAEEESPELGQTEQVVEDAMRRVDPE